MVAGQGYSTVQQCCDVGSTMYLTGVRSEGGDGVNSEKEPNLSFDILTECR